MKYRISAENPAQHLFRVQLSLEKSETGPLRLEIPRWRPGRYENALNPQKMADFSAWDAKSNTPLSFRRLSTHAFEIEKGEAASIRFEYLFYAAEKNAGSSYLDENLVYINFINLLVFDPQKVNEALSIEMDFAPDWKIACSMKREGRIFHAADFHEAVDSPLLASPQLNHLEYSAGNCRFHIWMWGMENLDRKKLLQDFLAFTEAQIRLFGEMPVNEYHFLFLFLPLAFYHGVEHQASTVIVLGPGHTLKEKGYDDLLGISSHELFHAWNVKAIRPAEMVPYDYTREAYSKLHYITEGITTYYGDLMLLKSGVWSQAEFLKEFHDSNAGRFFVNEGGKNVSLEQASLESWVNGYQDSVPNHKISFYAKGALVAFMLDQKIRMHTSDKFSLDSVMRELYIRFGKNRKGYTAEDFWSIAETQSGVSLQQFRKDFISGTADLDGEMQSAAKRIGFEWKKLPAAYSRTLQLWGFTFGSAGGKITVTQVFPSGAAAAAGLAKDDEIIALGRQKADATLNELAALFAAQDETEIHFFAQGILRQSVLKNTGRDTLPLWSMIACEKPDEMQLKNYSEWLKA